MISKKYLLEYSYKFFISSIYPYIVFIIVYGKYIYILINNYSMIGPDRVFINYYPT